MREFYTSKTQKNVMTVQFAPASLLTFILLLTFASMLLLQPAPAHGHGQGIDTLKSINIGAKKITLTAEMSNYLVPSDDQRITLTVTDTILQDTISDITLFVRMIHQNHTVFEERFYAPDGILRLDAITADDVAVLGEQDENGVWQPEPYPTVTGPSLGDGGLYSFEVGIEFDDPEILDDDHIYNMDVSVVRTDSYLQPALDGSDAQFRVKSYFDATSDFVYDVENSTIAFEMPFDWREKTISHIPVVHVEVHFSKDLEELMHPGYTAKINGVELFRNLATVDDYTVQSDRIVHFVLLGDHIKFLKNEQDGLIPNVMAFSLEASDEIQFPLVGYTRNEQFQVDMSWNPVTIQTQEPTTFVFTIRDGAAGEPLRHSSYDFVLLQDGVEIYRTGGSAAVGGSFAKYTFAEDQKGPTIIRLENIDGTGAVTEFGVVVVPEFGYVLVMMAAATTLATILGFRSRLLLRYP